MAGSVLLDSDAAIRLLRGDETLRRRLFGARVFLSAIGLGELYFGAAKSGRVDANMRAVDALAARASVLACDQETALQYGQVKARLKAAGRLIPENDIWIAATALQHGLTLLSQDRHFSEVDGLEHETS